MKGRERILTRTPSGSASTPRLRIRWPRGLSERRFLAEHWQRKPLVVRGALPGFRDCLPRRSLRALARREDVESRLVWHRGSRYRVAHGPQRDADLARLSTVDATLLVQGVDRQVPAVHALLEAFSFVPRARRDDLMVSDAAPGGGVGPHVDSYDVFLFQARGRRLWRIAREFDPELDEDAPLRLLRRFEPEEEFMLEPGDFLYLPPGVAHDGIALDDCATWSVGFRAPSARELAAGWCAWLEDSIQEDLLYADPGLALQRSASWLSDDYVRTAARLIHPLAFDRRRFERFVGCHLTEPRDGVVFDAPRRPLGPEALAARAAQRGLALATASALLWRTNTAFMNGEAVDLPPAAMPLVARLGDRRRLGASDSARALRNRSLGPALHDWYLAGYLAPA